MLGEELNMASVEKNIIVVFSGDGENDCYAIDEYTYDQIHKNELFHGDYDHFKSYAINKYVKMKNGERLYSIFPSALTLLLPKENPTLKGFRMKLILEPIVAGDIEEGWFE